MHRNRDYITSIRFTEDEAELLMKLVADLTKSTRRQWTVSRTVREAIKKFAAEKNAA